MDMFGKFKSLFGYENNYENSIDSFGVDHSGFSTRDELAYQFARNNRENELKQLYNDQGITENYQQFGKNFWGNSADNNYGFGNSDISENIENVKTSLPTLEQMMQSQYQINSPNNQTMATNLGQSGYEQNNSTINNEYNYSLYGNDFSKEQINEMNRDAKFLEALKRYAIPNEGGYSNNPNDRGGKTKYGISSRWYPNEDKSKLTRERANMILYRDYWKNRNINKLPDELAYRVFDDAIVQGQPTAIKNLQQALGLKADGLIGPNTLKAAYMQDFNTVRKKFIDNVNKVEDEYQKNDPSQNVFNKGHRNRFNKY